MSNPIHGIAAPPPMWCNRCGERFNRMNSAASHICSPNGTGFNPGDDVFVGETEGHVCRVDRGQVQVYFPSTFRTGWYSPTEIKRGP